jgi:hypothetical protein
MTFVLAGLEESTSMLIDLFDYRFWDTGSRHVVERHDAKNGCAEIQPARSV